MPSDQEAIQVAEDVKKSKLPKRYNITRRVAFLARERLRRDSVYGVGFTPDPDGGYWFREYEEK